MSSATRDSVCTLPTKRRWTDNQEANSQLFDVLTACLQSQHPEEEARRGAFALESLGRPTSPSSEEILLRRPPQRPNSALATRRAKQPYAEVASGGRVSKCERPLSSLSSRPDSKNVYKTWAPAVRQTALPAEAATKGIVVRSTGSSTAWASRPVGHCELSASSGGTVAALHQGRRDAAVLCERPPASSCLSGRCSPFHKQNLRKWGGSGRKVGRPSSNAAAHVAPDSSELSACAPTCQRKAIVEVPLREHKPPGDFCPLYTPPAARRSRPSSSAANPFDFSAPSMIKLQVPEQEQADNVANGISSMLTMSMVSVGSSGTDDDRQDSKGRHNTSRASSRAVSPASARAVP